jgi:hypothetical protein
MMTVCPAVPVPDACAQVSGTYYAPPPYSPPSYTALYSAEAVGESVGGAGSAPPLPYSGLLGDSEGGGSAHTAGTGVSTFRGSFVTSVGPSVSQAGQASLAGAAAAAVEADAARAGATQRLNAGPRAATTGGAHPSLHARGAASPGLPRQRHTMGSADLPPRAPPSPAGPLVAAHLHRALRAVSGGGAAAATPAPASPAPAAVSDAELHINRALRLLSTPSPTSGGAPEPEATPLAPAAAGPAPASSCEEAEVAAQEVS